MAESDKELALRALREALQDPATKPADRLRAAEAMLRAERDGPGGEGADVLALDDASLLLIAKGGTPPEKGPAGTSAATVPSRAPAPPTPTLPLADWGRADGFAVDNAQKANPFMQRGPKEDPSLHVPRGVPLAMGPKEDPDPWT